MIKPYVEIQAVLRCFASLNATPVRMTVLGFSIDGVPKCLNFHLFNFVSLSFPYLYLNLFFLNDICVSLFLVNNYLFYERPV